MNKNKFLQILALAILSLGATACDNPAKVEADPEDRHEHAPESGHGEHDEEDGDIVELSDDQAQSLGIVISETRSGSLGASMRLPAEIRYDADRIARIAAPIGGIVRELRKAEGDMAAPGDALAILSSRELADLKAAFLAAKSAEKLAKSELTREEKLFADKITAEADVLSARSAYAEAKASREAAETKLHALGIEHDVLDRLEHAEDGALSLYTLTSPIAGRVVRRNLTIGEAVDEGVAEPLFIVADTSVVWADIAVYKADLGKLKHGQNVRLEDDAGRHYAEGAITFISPVVDETSRTSTARVVLDNTDGGMRPGQFLTAIIETGGSPNSLSVESDAVQMVEGRPCVFIPSDHGFKPQPVRTGAEAAGRTEILSGLEAGDPYVSKGAFTLKAELEKSAFGDGHAH